MPGKGQVVGYISIKVTPDLDSFYADAKAAIERIERELKGEVKVSADMGRFREEVAAGTKALPDAKVHVKSDMDLWQKRVAAELASTHKRLEANIPLTVDGERFRRAVAKEVEEIDKGIKGKIPLDMELAAGQRAKLLSELAVVKRLAAEEPIKLKLHPEFDYRLKRALRKFEQEPLKLKLDPEFDYRLRSGLRKFEQEPIKLKLDPEFDYQLRRALARQRAKIKVEPDVDSFRVRMQSELKAAAAAAEVKIPLTVRGERLRAELAARVKEAEALIRADVPVKLHLAAGQRAKIAAEVAAIGRLSSGRFSSGPLGFIANLLSRGTGSFKLPDLAPNFMGLGAVGSITLIVGALSLLAPALALVSQALIGLPALISAVAVPIGVFALGFGGIKKALENSGLMDVFTGKRGKKTFGPGSVIQQMRQNISDVFDRGFTPLFQRVAVVIPQLTAGLPFVADGIVNLARGLTNAITNPENIANFDRLTNSISTMLTNLSPGLDSFATGMNHLITNVGDHLPGLGTTLSGYAKRFSTWVDEVSKPKQDWWGKQLPSTLDSAVSGMKPVLDSVVNFVGKLVDKGTELAADPKMIKGITDFIDGLTNLALQIAELAPVFEGVAGLLGKIPAPQRATVTDPATGKATPAPPPEPAKPIGHYKEGPKTPFELIGQALGSPQEWINGLKNAIGFDYGKKPLGEFGSTLEKQLVSKPFGVFGDFLKNLLGGTPKANADSAPFNPGTRVGAPAPSQDKSPGSLMLPPDQGQPPKQADAAKQAFSQVPSAVKSAMDAVVGVVQGSSAQIVAVFAALGPQIVAVVSSIRGQLVSAGTNLAAGLAEGIKAGIPAVTQAAGELAKAAESAAKSHLQIKSPSRVFFGIGENTAQGFSDGLSDGFQGVVSSASALVGQVQDALGKGLLPGSLKQNITQELKAIEVEYNQLRVARDSLSKSDKPGRDAISAQMKQLSDLRHKLQAQSSTAGYGSKYGGDQQQQITQLLGQQLSRGIGTAKDVAMAPANQFMQDIGISGSGAVPTIANAGLSWLTSALGSMASGAFGGGAKGSPVTFNVSSMDEAMSGWQNMKNKQALQYAGR